MKIFKTIDAAEEKLLNYDPIKEIYYVERHKFPLEDVKGMKEIIETNWKKILDNFICILKVLHTYIVTDDYLNNVERYINDEIYELNEKVSNIQLHEFNFAFDKKEKIVKITLLFNLYACCVVPQGNPKYLLEDGTLAYLPKALSYFRGEDNYDYSLLPSIYRGKEFNTKVEQFGDKGGTLTFASFLFDYYYKCGFIKRYDAFEKYNEVDYKFCSLMQHAGCKSPLLDVTQNSKIAVSFASSSKTDIDGSLYVFSNLTEVNESESMRDLSIFVINRKLDYLALIRNTPILLCNIKNFDVELKLLTTQTNDRMKFQKGAFLYINKCIIINHKILLPISNKNIKKYRISVDYKKIYQLKIEPRYKYEFLMDPYSYLKEQC